MLENQILSVKSKQEATAIALLALKEKSIYTLLLSNCNSIDLKLARKSAWVISAMFDAQPSYFNTNCEDLFKIILNELPSPVERSLIRIIAKQTIPDNYESALFDLCLKRLSDANTATANIAYSFDIAFTLCHKYPELKQELKLVIPMLKKHGTAGVLVKVRKFEKE